MKKKIIAMLVCFIAATTMTAQGAMDLTAWQAAAAGTAGNVVADNAGWTFDGTTGVEFDYGNLDEDDNTYSLGAGVSVEYIFNVTKGDSTTGALGSINGWANAETNILKVEQWWNHGVFGVTAPGVTDADFSGAPSTYDADTHVVFVNRADGEFEIFVNGVSMGIDSRGGGRWVSNGGVGGLGAALKGDGSFGDAVNGDIYAVGTYNRALDAGEIAALYTAVPEPATMALLALGGISVLRRKRKA